MSAEPIGVAIVTGGSSGIGFALTSHLVAKQWHVFILDVQPPTQPVSPESSTFIKTDVSKWEDNASAFEKAYAKFSRLDFCALNAGIDDRDDIFNTISKDPAKPPQKPNMLTFEVNLFAPYYGLKLAAHYMSLNPGPATQGGKIVITASAASFFAHPATPQYSATKYGALGLTRAMGPAATSGDIRINCVCPAMVVTSLAPPGLLEAYPESLITPMSTILRCFDELGGFDRLAREGRAEWVRNGHNGAAVLADRQDLVYKKEDNTLDFGDTFGADIGKTWMDVYRARNTDFARKAAE